MKHGCPLQQLQSIYGKMSKSYILTLSQPGGRRGGGLWCQWTGLETYFFSNSQTFASGFNLNSQIAVSNSQLVPTFEQFLTSPCGMAFVSLGWNLVPTSLAEDSPHLTSFFLFKKCVIFSTIAVTWLDPKTASQCYEALWFIDGFTVDWLKHLCDQDRDLVLAEISN